MKAVHRNKDAVLEASKTIHKYADDYATCWMCWMQLTDEELNDWRKEPFSDDGRHPSICPLCGYSNWTGRRWYPFYYLKWGVIGNPSSRIRPTVKARRRIY